MYVYIYMAGGVCVPQSMYIYPIAYCTCNSQ